MAIPLNMERSLLLARQWYSQLRWVATASRAAVLCCSLMCLHPVTRYGNYGKRRTICKEQGARGKGGSNPRFGLFLPAFLAFFIQVGYGTLDNRAVWLGEIVGWLAWRIASLHAVYF